MFHPRLSGSGQRLGGAFISAFSAGLFCAGLEASRAASVASQPLDELGTWLGVGGVVVPLAALIGLAVGLLCLVLHPSGLALRSLPRDIRLWLEEGNASAAGWPWLALGAALALGLLAHLALELLALELPVPISAAGLALAGTLLLRVVLGLASGLGRAAAAGGAPPLLGSLGSLLLGAFLFVAPIAWGILHGTPNGDGGFWGIFGVLRRQELELGAPVLCLVIACAAYLGALFWPAPAWGVAVCAAAAGLLVWGSAERWLNDVPRALAIQRGTSIARFGLSLERRLADGDRDGISRSFGGGDCNDRRADVYPGAIDTPGNGLDEDCSGADEPAALAILPAPPPQAAPTKRPLPPDLNVILITVDTLRHDLGYTGYPRAITPNIDRLAVKSVVFDKAYALASYTGKSVGPLLIGRYPSETHRGWLHFNRFGSEDVFVQERLQRAGIRTLSIQGHWYFTPEYGVGRGFDVLDLSAAPAQRQLEGDRTVNSAELTNAALAQLGKPENSGQRFFLWVHYLDPHADYFRHPEFDFGPKARDSYDSEVAFVDQHVGRLLDYVQAAEFGARTAIIVSSDHGEAFGENKMWRHGFELWEVLVRVPLVVYVPGLPPARVGVRRSAIDLAPTLLELFGQPLPEGEDTLSGQSLLGDLLAQPDDAPRARPVFIDMSAGPYNEERQALIVDDFKIIMANGRLIGIYNLKDDPAEANDLRADTALKARLLEQFQAFRRGLRLVNVKPE
jgi:choline-sulfatase